MGPIKTMITKLIFTNHICNSKPLIYFSGKNYTILKPLIITKTKKNHFWFDAMIINNDNSDNKEFDKVGSVHSYSNSFIVETIDQLEPARQANINNQIMFIRHVFNVR